MKKLSLIFTILIISISCTNNNTYTNLLENNAAVTSVFNKKEISELKSIISFFDSTLNINQNYNIQYREYFSNLDKEESIEELVELVGFQESASVKRLIKKLEQNDLFNQIWVNSTTNKKVNNEYIPIKCLELNINSKYVETLRILAKEHPFYSKYIEILERLGSVSSPSSSAYILKEEYKTSNFENEFTRLFFAIHYITITSDL